MTPTKQDYPSPNSVIVFFSLPFGTVALLKLHFRLFSPTSDSHYISSVLSQRDSSP